MKVQPINTIQYNVKKNNYHNNYMNCSFVMKEPLKLNYFILPYQPSFGNKSNTEKDELKQKNIYQLTSEGFESIKIKKGTISNTGKYLMVSSKEDLKAISQTPSNWNKIFVLTNNIDLDGEEITPIGNVSKIFTGVFDGNGYQIQNFKINQPNRNNVGLFGFSQNAEFRNLSLAEFSIIGYKNVGAVSGVSTKCIFDSIKTCGDIQGHGNIGELCGYDLSSYINKCLVHGNIYRKNSIDTDNFWDEKSQEEVNFVGGIVGIADSSIISASYSATNLNADKYIGGLIGVGKNCSINDAVYAGKIQSNDNTTGTFIGEGDYNKIKNSYAISAIPFIGKSEMNTIGNSFSDIKDLTTGIANTWDKTVWNISPYKIPRLKLTLKDINPQYIFLEDLQNDVDNRIIGITNIDYKVPQYISIKLDDMEPPKHYAEHNEILDKIKNSDSNSYLTKQFIYYTDEFRDDFDEHSHKDDEILLAIVNNPYFNLNKRYDGIRQRYSSNIEAGVFCTPLYILSRMEKGYIFQEALKKSSIDPYVMSGYLPDTDIFKAQFCSTNTTNMFLLLTSKNPIIQEYVKTRLKELPELGLDTSTHEDMLTDFLLNNPESNFIYDDTTQTLKIPTKLFIKEKIQDLKFSGNDKFNSLYDVLESPDINPNYKDSMGNSILHILPNIAKKDQLILLNFALAKGADINLQNNEGKTPKELAVDSENIDLATIFTLNKSKDMFNRNSNLDDMFMLNVKSPEPNSLINMIKLHESGFSINTQNQDGTTTLIEAIKNNDLSKINYLLSQGANVNICDKNGQTALHHAFIQKNPQIIKWLLNKFAYPSVKDNLDKLPQDYWIDCLDTLSKNGINLEAIKKEYELSFNVKKVSNQKIQHTDTEITEARAWYKPDNNDIYNPKSNLYQYDGQIYKFISSGTPNNNEINKDTLRDILKIMITNYNPNGEEVLLYIMKKYNYKISDFNSNKSLLVITLEAYNNAQNISQKLISMQYIKFLLDNNANVDFEDSNHQTPLYLAIFSSNLLIFNEILGKHPNINHTDLLGHTPLFYLGKNPESPMRKIFNIYAKKRNISLPDEYEQILKKLTKKGFTIKK